LASSLASIQSAIDAIRRSEEAEQVALAGLGAAMQGAEGRGLLREILQTVPSVILLLLVLLFLTSACVVSRMRSGRHRALLTAFLGAAASVALKTWPTAAAAAGVDSPPVGRACAIPADVTQAREERGRGGHVALNLYEEPSPPQHGVYSVGCSADCRLGAVGSWIFNLVS
jgi:hypothetical protein